MKIAVLGAGSWGTAIAALLCDKGYQVILWARRAEIAETINKRHFNPDYLSDSRLPENLKSTDDPEEALSGARVVALGIPSSYFRGTLGRFKDFVNDDCLILSLTKGLEQKTLFRMSQVILDILGNQFRDRIAVLSGPNHSEEVIKRVPTATVIASENENCSGILQEVFMSDYFRVYTNKDVTGVELGGAIKNVMAIAVGISDGLGYGDNTRATLITRGLAEMARLGTKLGANPFTFLGLAGLGDLVATATSRHSRNRMVGERIGRGETLDSVTKSMKMVAEGIPTSRSVLELSRKLKVEIPITHEVVEILFENKEPKESVLSLMLRKPKAEEYEKDYYSIFKSREI